MIIKLTKQEVYKICSDYLFDKFNRVMEFYSVDYEHYEELVFKDKEVAPPNIK